MGSVALNRERALIGQKKKPQDIFLSTFPLFDLSANNIKEFFCVDSTPSKLRQLPEVILKVILSADHQIFTPIPTK